MFKHFLFTRFNLVIAHVPDRKTSAFRSIEKSNKDRLDPDWLYERLELFRNYCLPSIKNQDTDNFEWIVLMHSDTPKDIVNSICEHTSVFLSRSPDWEAAHEVIKDTERFTITSNLDSDDAITKNFISSIQKEFRGKREYLNIPEGFIASVYKADEVRLYLGRRSEKNPYQSFIDDDKHGKRTVYYTTHGLTYTNAPVRQIENTSASWLQTIHGDNLANRLKKCKDDKLVPLSKISERFSIK